MQDLAYSLMNKQKQAVFEMENELDMSYAVDGVSRFRVNIYRQRNTVGVLVVMADDGSAFGNALAQDFRINIFNRCGLLHFVGNNALAGQFELGQCVLFLHESSLLYMCLL